MVIEPLGYPLSKQNLAKNGYRTTWISTHKAKSSQIWLSNNLDIHFQGNIPPKMVIEPLGYPLSRQHPAKNGYRTTWLTTLEAKSSQKWLSNHLVNHYRSNFPPKMVIEPLR
jgi:hypothetical protein